MLAGATGRSPGAVAREREVHALGADTDPVSARGRRDALNAAPGARCPSRAARRWLDSFFALELSKCACPARPVTHGGRRQRLFLAGAAKAEGGAVRPARRRCEPAWTTWQTKPVRGWGRRGGFVCTAAARRSDRDACCNRKRRVLRRFERAGITGLALAVRRGGRLVGFFRAWATVMYGLTARRGGAFPKRCSWRAAAAPPIRRQGWFGSLFRSDATDLIWGTGPDGVGGGGGDGKGARSAVLACPDCVHPLSRKALVGRRGSRNARGRRG